MDAIRVLVGVAVMIMLVICCAGCGRDATPVTMQVQVQVSDEKGQLQTVTVPCTGYIIYRIDGRIQIVSGIGPEMNEKGELP